MKRLIYAAVLMAAMPQLTALADPSPSPSLQSILVAPPSEFTAPVNGNFQGQLTQSGFAGTWGPDSARAESELGNDGYVDGFGMMRADTASGRLVVEFALAFTGQSGALRFLGSDQNENKADVHYQHSDEMAGVGPYYFGVHEATTSEFLDGFEFVKGNDMFGVAFYSSKDDVLALAMAQARKQYDAAPAQTISPDQWPENRSVDTGSGVPAVDSQVLIGVAVVGLLIAGAIFVWMRRNELRPQRAAAPAPEMTADGQFWWSGTYWVATSEMAPPWAQRSPDGAFWWDGHAWKPVPLPTPPVVR